MNAKGSNLGHGASTRVESDGWSKASEVRVLCSPP